MARRLGRSYVLALGTLALTTLLLAGCGDEASSPGPQEPAPWSAPPEAGDRATGSPDGDGEGGVQGPAAVLAALRARIARGEGQSDPSFQREVENVAAVLWPPDPTPASQQAARVHMQIAHIAGEVSQWLAASDQARAERLVSHPTDVAIHDAFLEAAGGGLEAYRTWCAGAGARLLSEYKQAQYERLVPPPR